MVLVHPQVPNWTPVDENVVNQRGTGHVFGFGPFSDTPFSTVSSVAGFQGWSDIDDFAPTDWTDIEQ